MVKMDEIVNATSPDVNVTDRPENITVHCSNEECVSDEEYLAMIEAYIFPRTYEWVLIVLYIVVFIVGLSGNFLVCYAVWKNPRMRTVTNFFIVNLAIADFMVILFCLPTTVLQDVTETWYMGSVMCKLVVYLQGVSVSVSVMTLSFISVERWYAICHPLSFKSTPTRARYIIGGIWTASMLIYIPEIVVLDIYPYQGFPEDFTIYLTICKPSWSYESQKAFQLFLIVALYFVPFSLMGFAYYQIGRCLWKNAIPTENSNHFNGHRKSRRQQDCRRNAETQLQSRRKAAKMLLAVVVMFLVCYLPVHLLNILRYAKLLPGVPYVNYFALISHWLCYFNSAINPVIYNFMSVKFRREFKYSCSCCIRLCCPDLKPGRKQIRESTMSYKYNNSFSQTEAITLTSMKNRDYQP